MTGLSFRSVVLYLVCTWVVRSDAIIAPKSAMTSRISMEFTGMTRSSLRSPSTIFSISPRVSLNETAVTAPLILLSEPKALHAFKHPSTCFFSCPLMPVMVQPPLLDVQNSLTVVQVWGFSKVCGLSQPHGLIALSKNPLGRRCQETCNFAHGSVGPSETEWSACHLGSSPECMLKHSPTPSSPFGKL